MVIGSLENNKWLKYGIWGVIAMGVLLRLAVYLQAISPYNDEACVIRNIYERDYLQLTQVLDYYQYAPPIFLWIIKASTDLFGFSEYALRIYPFLCGTIAILLLYSVGKHYTNKVGLLYALLLFGTGLYFVRYTAVVKQYIPDLAVALFLIWLALQYRLSRSAVSLFFIWAIAGSLAVWSSMPSVFVLAAVGLYYFVEIIKAKDYNKLWFIVGAGFIWLVQFGLYYMLILKPQANSDYLQNYHKWYFLHWPKDMWLLKNDLHLFFGCIGTAGGDKLLALIFHSICIVIGVVCLYKAKATKLILIGLPILLMLFAAAVHQYTLIERVTLFAMPGYLILIGAGFGKLFEMRFSVLKLVLVVIAAINFANHNVLKNFVEPMEEEDIKKSMAYLQKERIAGNSMLIHQYPMHAYLYYTTMHSDSARYADLKGGTEFTWETDMDSIAQAMPNRFAVLYSWDEESTIQNRMGQIKQHATLVDSNMVKNGRVYIFEKK